MSSIVNESPGLSASKSNDTLSTRPDDVLQCIVDGLGAPDIKSLSLTCKANSLRLRRRVFRGLRLDRSEQPSHELVEELASAGSVRHLTLGNLSDTLFLLKFSGITSLTLTSGAIRQWASERTKQVRPFQLVLTPLLQQVEHLGLPPFASATVPFSLLEVVTSANTLQRLSLQELVEYPDEQAQDDYWEASEAESEYDEDGDAEDGENDDGQGQDHDQGAEDEERSKAGDEQTNSSVLKPAASDRLLVALCEGIVLRTGDSRPERVEDPFGFYFSLTHKTVEGIQESSLWHSSWTSLWHWHAKRQDLYNCPEMLMQDKQGNPRAPPGFSLVEDESSPSSRQDIRLLAGPMPLMDAALVSPLIKSILIRPNEGDDRARFARAWAKEHFSTDDPTPDTEVQRYIDDDVVPDLSIFTKRAAL